MIVIYTGADVYGSAFGTRYQKGVPTWAPNGWRGRLAMRNDFEVYEIGKPTHAGGGQKIYIFTEVRLRAFVAALWTIEKIHAVYPTCNIVVQSYPGHVKFLPPYCTVATEKRGTYYRDFDLKVSNSPAADVVMALEVPLQHSMAIAADILEPEDMVSIKQGYVSKTHVPGSGTLIIDKGDNSRTTAGLNSDLAERLAQALQGEIISYTTDWDEVNIDKIGKAGRVIALGDSSYTALALSLGIPVFYFNSSMYLLNLDKQYRIYANGSNISLAGIASIEDAAIVIINAVDKYAPRVVDVAPPVNYAGIQFERAEMGVTIEQGAEVDFKPIPEFVERIADELDAEEEETEAEVERPVRMPKRGR